MLLEHGVAASAAGATPGQFPQIGGMWMSYDLTGTAQVQTDDGSGNFTITTPGDRVKDLYVDTTGDARPETALYINGVAQAAASATYKLVTLNFLAYGGDNYPFSALSAPNFSQTYSGLGFGDPDANNDGLPDATELTGCDPGMQTAFSSTGGEQDALAEYFLATYPNMATPYSTAETPKAMDMRIQDLADGSFVAP